MQARTDFASQWSGRLIALALVLALGATVAQAAAPEKKMSDKELAALRPIRVAAFDIDVRKGLDADGTALADRVNAMLAGLPKVTIVNRTEMKKVADEHKIALSGLVDNASAVQLGKFVSAQYVICGGASKIGQTFYLVLKIIDVETTVQTVVSAKASVEDGLDTVLVRLGDELAGKLRELQGQPAGAGSDAAAREAWEKLAKLAKPLVGKTVMVSISESHVGRPLTDPAAQMAVTNALKRLGVNVLVPKDPAAGWKDAVMGSGKFSDEKVDYLLEGEGTSAYAAEIQGLISCRARVELRLILVPGRNILVAEKGVAAKVDLVEALAAKGALEDAGVQALEAVIGRLAESAAKDR